MEPDTELQVSHDVYGNDGDNYDVDYQDAITDVDSGDDDEMFLVFLLNLTLFCALQHQDHAQATPPSPTKVKEEMREL